MPDGLVEIVAQTLIDIAKQVIAKYVLYPIGWLTLKTITLGTYPSSLKQHNRNIVSAFGMATILASITLIYS